MHSLDTVGSLALRYWVSMQWMSRHFDYARKIQVLAKGADEINRRRIFAIVRRLLLTDKANAVLNYYYKLRNSDKSQVSIIVNALLRYVRDPITLDLRWASRWVLGQVIGINIQAMFETENKADLVLARFRGEKDANSKEIMREILDSCLMESQHSNIYKSAAWVVGEITKDKASSPVENHTTIEGLIISIDGVARSGKTTIAKAVADILGGNLFDRGLVFRAMTYKALAANIVFSNESAILDMIDGTDISIVQGRMILDGTDITDNLYTEEINKNVSKLWQTSKLIEEKFVEVINRVVKMMTMEGPVIITGRNKYSFASTSYFVTVSLEERARRELMRIGQEVNANSLAEMMRAVSARDEKDKIPEPAEGTVVVINENLDNTITAILLDIDKKLSAQLDSLQSNSRRPIKGFNLNPFYSPRLPIRFYTVNQIQKLLANKVDELASELDLTTLRGKVEYLLLMTRRDYFMQMLSEPENDFYKALIGIYGVAPYVAAQACLRDGINVFLMRDAGRD